MGIINVLKSRKKYFILSTDGAEKKKKQKKSTVVELESINFKICNIPSK